MVPLGVPSLIGALMPIGIEVTNALVLVDLINQYREHGLSGRDAVVHGSARRLRPILMTALADRGRKLVAVHGRGIRCWSAHGRVADGAAVARRRRIV